MLQSSNENKVQRPFGRFVLPSRKERRRQKEGDRQKSRDREAYGPRQHAEGKRRPGSRAAYDVPFEASGRRDEKTSGPDRGNRGRELFEKAIVMLALSIRPRNVLGRKESVELGQAPTPQAAVPPPGPNVLVTRDEGQLMVLVYENIVAFKDNFPIEFISYCPPERWQKTIERAVGWTLEIERQLKEGKQSIVVPAEAVFRLVDLEKCISAAKDARLSSTKVAFTISAVAALGGTLFGLTWLSLPAYLAGLALILGRPLAAKLNPEPQDPYRPSLEGNDCPHEDEEALGDHTDKAKVLERVIVCPRVKRERHHWGEVLPAPGPVEGSVCLAKGRFRVRVEGWAGDRILPAEGWSAVKNCEARKEIAVWQPCSLPARATIFGPIPEESGHEETYWIEYAGPLTAGTCRAAGPFG